MTAREGWPPSPSCCFTPRPAIALGWSSVDCFFVLSGFLITTILLRNRDESRLLLNFYARRALRIWPIYYLSLLGLMVLNRVLDQHFPTAGLPYYLTYIQNISLYWSKHVNPFIPAFGHTWTLAMEEQYYLIWPLLVACADRRTLTAASFGFLAISVFLRFEDVPSILLFGRGDGFALGSLMALIFTADPDPAHIRRRLLGFGVSVLASATAVAFLFLKPSMIQTPWRPISLKAEYNTLILPMSMLYFGAIGMIVCLKGSWWTTILRLRPLTYLGQISYGLYLYHLPIMYAVEGAFRKFAHYRTTFGPERPFSRTVLELAITLAVAALSWHLIEKPFLALKDRFKYTPRSRISP